MQQHEMKPFAQKVAKQLHRDLREKTIAKIGIDEIRRYLYDEMANTEQAVELGMLKSLEGMTTREVIMLYHTERPWLE